MKLCWGLLTRINVLWVKNLNSRDECAYEIPIVNKKKALSLTQNVICDVQRTFKSSVGRKIANKCSSTFWMKNCSKMNVPLTNCNQQKVGSTIILLTWDMRSRLEFASLHKIEVTLPSTLSSSSLLPSRDQNWVNQLFNLDLT